MNALTLAVAGGRKTQSIIDACAEAPAGRRILVLTYTQQNQAELTSRLAARRPLAATVHVQGWFSFLLGHCVRPYVPLAHPGHRLRGLNFDGDPGRFATGARRFLDGDGRAYKRCLANLAHKTNDASQGAALDRISRIYDEAWIDEVQDLNGWDLEILALLMRSPLDLYMVGDIRQAILNTNDRDLKHRQYKGVKIKVWFDLQADKERLKILHAAETWRCNQTIATFADSIFGPEWGFETTVSRNQQTVPHSGIFVVSVDDAEAYFQAFAPLCLRYNAGSWKEVDLPFRNIGLAKGRGAEHVLVAPTTKMEDFVRSNKPLEPATACSLYVAVTRAHHSVAFLSKTPDRLGLPIWRPVA
ncbi:UvrD-helicase domain-containing protein [Micromonospora sp. WMMC250]|uniref:UvrD-helicase domain-containing protein n=1 Tax=Micromonospora sp. WMMC250 TaxID=3014781 RepID=UPI0022B67ABF|nr:UvrD-helicase domain-containing protein [Micromonospora sp. WMMC250]MCZ7375316.1 UvrD-helicase domain-containing protein [Micromonospora sp. WMMC250]